MKVTVFTGNQRRHLSLIRDLAAVADTVYAVVEATTVFPGQVKDFYEKSDVMQRYFHHVAAAEQKIFGHLGFAPPNVRSLSLKLGDLNMLSRDHLADALQSDVYVVFGASYVKGWLVEHLVQHGAINIHAGLSPYYRGASCNFWAVYDGNPHMAGATIHQLSRGLDSGPILFHALPQWDGETPFEFTMKAVLAAHKGLAERIASREIFELEPVNQDKSAQVRYSRYVDFDDSVAQAFLDRRVTAQDLKDALHAAQPVPLVRPYYL